MAYRGDTLEPTLASDEEVFFERITPDELGDLKSQLLNAVSSSLIKEPKFSDNDSITNTIKRLVKQIAFYDPEFILKVALYSRDDLNIRSTSNFVIAVASNIKQCQPYLKRYFSRMIRLPSDWLDVASTYQILPDRYLKDGSLPTSLRKSMVDKFAEFDVYQLGKYNKEKTIKKKTKQAKKLAETEPEKAEEKKGEKPTLTIKQMIRQLHISKPTQNVMSLLGKKYPATEEEFHRLGFPGKWERERAGKRMKLPIPETWETLLSEKGNRAATWEELIEHKKLPFMAMLRNLRNLIFTGVHPRYHRWVMNKLTSETSIAGSRQFPTRFFSAYEVIPKDMEDFKRKLAAQNDPPKKGKGNEDEAKRRVKKNVLTPAYMPSPTLFQEYRESLDNAVKLATVHNVKPIQGSTVVFVNASPSMNSDCSTARGMGAIRKLNEVATLLGLMCKYACEECEVRIFSSPSATHSTCHIPVDLIPGSILENVKV